MTLTPCPCGTGWYEDGTTGIDGFPRLRPCPDCHATGFVKAGRMDSDLKRTARPHRQTRRAKTGEAPDAKRIPHTDDH